MSSGPVCRVKGHDHVVYARRCNFSAFNGYHRTSSAYSGIVCLQTFQPWRAKGRYVDRLPDITPEQRELWRTGHPIGEP